MKPFSLPPDIKFHKKTLPQGGFAYVFRHNTLGKLGRLLVIPQGNQSHIMCEVAGDPKDPMTEKRRNLFQPITTALTKELEKAYGRGQEVPPPQSNQEPKQLIKSKVLVCLTCNTPVAMLIFAEGAYSPDRLEDSARLMYTNIASTDLPTWIIGAEEAITKEIGKAWTLKVWPNRETACQTLSTELNPLFEELQNNHCPRGAK